MDLFILSSSNYHLKIFLFLLVNFFPKCLCVDLTYRVEEGQNPGFYIGDIAADSKIAKDYENLDKITFNQLQQLTGSSELFRVSKKTGKLYTMETLDAEMMCKINEECFKMVDVAVQKGSSTLKILEVKIIIQDVNDHQPQFPIQEVNIEFDEGDAAGMKKSIPNAIDKDVGIINSHISYELIRYKDEPFKLLVSKKVDGTAKLEISLEKRLDRETKMSYLIQIVAKDGGSPPKQTALNVHISVLDINDNAPIFSQKVFNVSLKNEPSETIPIIVLAATDLDSGNNGKISYSFSSKTSKSANEIFELNKMTGEIFQKNYLETRLKQIYKLYVEAIDGGQPPLSSVTLVLVKLINPQNNPPFITVNFASKSKENMVDIYEDMKIGSFIAYVKVVDQDEGANGDIICTLHHDKFQIQSMGSKKYEVTLKNPLDREKEQQHDVVISCQDKGSPSLHSNSKFSIQVMDINDVEPQFTKDTFKFFVDENENSRITVGYINATDPDLGAGGKLSYSLITNNKQFLPFKINTRNGLLSAIMSLDHEFQHTYQFQVFVKDNGTPSLNNTVNVIVEVTDKNDNAPYFTFPSVKPYNLDVTYYQHHSKNITEIKAADSDSQENAFLKYEIIRGNDKQMFTINQYTGLLAFNRQLSPQNAGSYQLDIRVKDSGSPVLSATTTLFLTLTISNKTSLQILNVVQLPTEEKVHLNLVIIITVIAVTIAVFITASLSICIIRCNAHSNVAYAQALHPSNRYVSEQRHLIAPSYQPNSWPRPNHPIAPDQLPSTNTPLTSSTRQLTSADQFPQKPHQSNDITSQQYTQNLSFPPDYFGDWRTTLPSLSNNKHNCYEEDLLQNQEKNDLFSLKNSQPGQLSKNDISVPYPQSRNLLEMNNQQQTSNSRPLPPVPRVDH